MPELVSGDYDSGESASVSFGPAFDAPLVEYIERHGASFP